MKKGIESFRAAVKRDCDSGEGCFSEVGCTKQRYRYEPQENPALVEMGFKTKCVANTKCFHDFCGKYAWVMDRAKIYAERTGKTAEEVLEIWEEDRGYWYMNYYQECNQPIGGTGMISTNRIAEMQEFLDGLNERIEFYEKMLNEKGHPEHFITTAKNWLKEFNAERDKTLNKLRMAELNSGFKPEVLITRAEG